MIRRVAFTVYPARDLERAWRFSEDGLGIAADEYAGTRIECQVGGGAPEGNAIILHRVND